MGEFDVLKAIISHRSPRLLVESLALAFICVIILSLLILIWRRSIRVFKTRNFFQMTSLGLLVGVCIPLILYVFVYYVASPSWVVLGVINTTGLLIELCYLLFQFSVLDRLRPPPTDGKRLFLTIIVTFSMILFLATGAPTVLLYFYINPYVPMVNNFLNHWYNVAIVWQAYGVIMDFVINLYLLHIMIRSSNENSTYNQAAYRLKMLMGLLCLGVLISDGIGVWTGVYTNVPVTEDDVSYIIAMNSVAFGALGLHFIIGLSYLSLLLALSSRLKETAKKETFVAWAWIMPSKIKRAAPYQNQSSNPDSFSFSIPPKPADTVSSNQEYTED